MYNYSGIVYRLWAVCGVFAIIGVLCILFAWIGTNKPDRRGVGIGTAMIILSLMMSIKYIGCLLNPEVESFTGTLYEITRDSTEAPPLPFTMEYSFFDENGNPHSFYLDTFSKKNMLSSDFVVGTEYEICYDTKTNIIVDVSYFEP